MGGRCRRFLVALLHLVCFYPKWDEKGWGKGQEEERRSKRAGGKRERERAGRQVEPKGKVVTRCQLASE